MPRGYRESDPFFDDEPSDDLDERIAAVQETEGLLKRLHPDDPRHKKETLHAAKLELDLAVRRGEFLDRQEVRALQNEQDSALKSQLEAIPGRISIKLANMTDPRVIDRLLKTEIHKAYESYNADLFGAKEAERPAHEAAPIDELDMDDDEEL